MVKADRAAGKSDGKRTGAAPRVVPEGGAAVPAPVPPNGLGGEPMVHVLIPVHNRIHATLECLGCLARQTYRNFRTVVVDDGSADGTSDTLHRMHPQVEVLKGDGSLWWTGAVHMGVEHIRRRAREGDFVLSLNNDTFFEPDFMENLVRASLSRGRALAGSMQKDYFNREVILNAGVWLDWASLEFKVKRALSPEEMEARLNEDVNVLPGRSLLIPVEVFDEIGNFNRERCPHYIADYEFTMRAFNRGLRLVLSYESVVYARTDLTGTAIKEQRPLRFGEIPGQLFSRRSDFNRLDLFNFILLQCPREHRVKNILRVLHICFRVLVDAFVNLRVLAPLRRAARRRLRK